MVSFIKLYIIRVQIFLVKIVITCHKPKKGMDLRPIETKKKARVLVRAK